MSKWLTTFVVMVALLALVGCNSDHENHEMVTPQEKKQTTYEPLQVKIMIPEKLKPGQEYTLQTELSQAKEQVTDADKVEFEVWKDREKKDSVTIPAKHEKNGKYTAKHVFKEQGVYFVQAHASARGTHVMPIKRLIVGNVSPDAEQDKQEMDMNMNAGHH